MLLANIVIWNHCNREENRAHLSAGEDSVESVIIEGLNIKMTALFGFSAGEESPTMT